MRTTTIDRRIGNDIKTSEATIPTGGSGHIVVCPPLKDEHSQYYHVLHRRTGLAYGFNGTKKLCLEIASVLDRMVPTMLIDSDDGDSVGKMYPKYIRRYIQVCEWQRKVIPLCADLDTAMTTETHWQTTNRVKKLKARPSFHSDTVAHLNSLEARLAKACPPKQDKTLPTLSELTIYDIARLIRKDWRTKDGTSNVYFGAVPYLSAMGSLSSVDDDYGHDSGKSVVIYFLANASAWRGPVARAVKAELKKRTK